MDERLVETYLRKCLQSLKTGTPRFSDPPTARCIIHEVCYAPSDLQLPLWQWSAGNVYLLVLSKAKR